MKKISTLVFLFLGLGVTTFAQQKDTIAPLNNSMKRIISISPTDAAGKYIGINYEYLFPKKHWSISSGIGYQIPTDYALKGFSLETAVKFYIKAAPNGFFLNAGLKFYSKQATKVKSYIDSDTLSNGFNIRFSESLPQIRDSYTKTNLQFTFGGGFQDTYGKNNQWVLEVLAYFAMDLNDSDENYSSNYIVVSSKTNAGNNLNRRYYVYYPNNYETAGVGRIFNARINIGYRF